MAFFSGLIIILSLLSVTVSDVIYYQPEAVHLAYGGNTCLKLFIFLIYYSFKSLL